MGKNDYWLIPIRDEKVYLKQLSLFAAVD